MGAKNRIVSKDLNMTTIIHCADLHLTSGKERDYSLAVLDEILTVKFRSDRGSLADSGLLDIVVCLANERGARSWLGQAGMPVMNSTETRKM